MKNTIVLAALLLSSTAAFAAGPYLGVSGGSADQKIEVEGESVSESSSSVKVYGGYQFASKIGIESGYVHFGEAEQSVFGVPLVSKVNSFYTAVTGIAAVSPSFNLFGKLGVATNQAKVSLSFDGGSFARENTRISAMFGLGAQYKFTDNLSVVAEYENFGKVFSEDGLTVKASLVSAGLRYTF